MDQAELAEVIQRHQLTHLFSKDGTVWVCKDKGCDFSAPASARAPVVEAQHQAEVVLAFIESQAGRLL